MDLASRASWTVTTDASDQLPLFVSRILFVSLSRTTSLEPCRLSHSRTRARCLVRLSVKITEVRMSSLTFGSLGNFVLSTLSQFTQLHERVIDKIQWWLHMYEYFSRCNCSVAECLLSIIVIITTTTIKNNNSRTITIIIIIIIMMCVRGCVRVCACRERSWVFIE